MRIDKKKILEIVNKLNDILKDLYSNVKPFSKFAYEFAYDKYLILVKKINELGIVIKNKVMTLLEESKFDFSIIKNIHFSFHYLVTITMVAFMAFFVTFYMTGYNTAQVDAASMVAPEVETVNKKAYDVNYGDHDALVSIAREVVSEHVSVVEDPVILEKNGMSVVCSIDRYIVEIYVQTSELGKTKAVIKVQTKETYYRNDFEKIMIGNEDQIDVVDGTAMTYEVELNIIDTVAPVISLSEADMTMKDTDEFDIKNFVRVTDNLDGYISDYQVENMFDKVDDDKWEYGKHILVIRAKDSSGNESSREMIVRIYKTEEEPVYSAPKTYHTYGNYSESPYAGSIIAEARKHIGKAYVYGATGPYAFDCSGFTQYVYAKAGISLPRTSGSQSYVGVPINPHDMSQWRAGDLVTYGYGGNSHVAIYSGYGTLIHAVNPALGVNETSVSGFFSGPIYAVRRVQ